MYFIHETGSGVIFATNNHHGRLRTTDNPTNHKVMNIIISVDIALQRNRNF